MSTSLVLRDPTPESIRPALWWQRPALIALSDPSDLPLLRPIAMASFVLLPSAAGLYLFDGLRLARSVLHFAAYAVMLGPFVLMVHNLTHRPATLRKPHRWVAAWVQWIVGPLLGMTPNTYHAHHLVMHHREGNLLDDLSSTMPYRRDSPRDFLKYFLRFFFGILFELTAYMWRRRQRQTIRRMLFGEFCFYALVIVLFLVNPWATTVVFVAPFVFVRLMMMIGNWSQHAFIDPGEPTSPYRNTVTCINNPTNQWGFNDGYHIGHHLQPALHWLDYPGELAANQARYAREGALVFEGIDFFGIWLGLMSRRYEWLARRLVPLGDAQPALAEVARMLRARAQPVLARADTRAADAVRVAPADR